MKKLVFRKVRIERETRRKWDDKTCVPYPLKGDRIRYATAVLNQELDREYIEAESHEQRERALERHDRRMSRYRSTLGRWRSEKMRRIPPIDTKWRIVDEETGDVIGRFDSIQQAKRYCTLNDFDFGQYGRR